MSRILIIEDEEAIADLEKDYLELSGFEVEIACQGGEGLKRAGGGFRFGYTGFDAAGDRRL